jgi:DDE family transposase
MPTSQASSCHTSRRGAGAARRAAPPRAPWDLTDWEQLLCLLPGDLEASGRAAGALTRCRAVPSCTALLRLVLVYCLSGWSLRLVAAWALLSGLGRLSDVALLYRLRQTRRWLGELVAALVLTQRVQGGSAAVRLRLLDATVVSAPGRTGAQWRLHVSLDLGRNLIDGLELTDGRRGETLVRHPAQPGDIQLADGGYSHKRGLAAVLAQGGAVVVRYAWQTLPLDTPTGQPLALWDWLAALAPTATTERWVRVRPPDGGQALRLIAYRLSPTAAATARRKVRRHAAKKGKLPSQRSLQAAEYVLLVTNLDPAAWSTAAVLALYRLRWQVELLFKRLKGIWHLDHLRAQQAELAQVFLLGLLLALLLADRWAQPLPPPCADWFAATDRPLSLWRWQTLWRHLVHQAVVGGLEYAAVLGSLARVRRHLCDPPRHRAQQAALGRQLWRSRLTTAAARDSQPSHPSSPGGTRIA